MTAPLLVFGWGNPSRGDDALGPLFVDALRAAVGGDGPARIEFLDDYQLAPEHALDLVGRERVLLVDAGIGSAAPFEVTRVEPARDAAYTTHALSPPALLQVYRELHGEAPPPCTLLAIRGERFELGEPPGPRAMDHLAAALHWARGWLGADQVNDRSAP